MERVHAIACLVGGGAWSPAAKALLRRLDESGIDIGLHLDLTEAPLLAGSRRPLSWLIGASLLRRIDARHLRAEIRAQLDLFEQALGHGPAFVDGHQHVHQLPVVRHELLHELLDRYAHRLPWLRSTRPARGVATSMIKARGIQMLGSGALDSAARRMGFVQNHHLLGVYDFTGGARRYRRLLAAWVRSARVADLLMCHAGWRPDPGDPLGAARQWEYEAIAGEDFGAMLRSAGVRLLPMSRIVPGPAPSGGFPAAAAAPARPTIKRPQQN